MQKIKGDDIMAGSYDGSIRIDTSINTSPINRGLSQIDGMLNNVGNGFTEIQGRFNSIGDGFSQMEGKLKSFATVMGVAFGVKALVDFGKRAVTAASDLAEAQNVVDTAFGDMSWKMEQFAATALETYGISELTAKNMGSTYMAMAKGMGVATDAASDMAVTLTGRLSDIMSFYNKTQSQVDTIGRALITGETEPLKAIGVVMTQTNLSAYAMAQGFAKTYDEMSSNEQLLVRYKYFLEQTALAQDDFAKTSEGWANQTRLLSERLNEFMTNFGSLIMNTLTPALEFANEAVSFLNELFFGRQDSAENTTAVKNAEAVTDEVTSMGAAADKSKKKLNNLIAGFDELHVISGASSEDKEQATDAGIDTSNLLGVNLDGDVKKAKKAAGKYRDVINEIYLAFKRHPLTKAIENIIGGIKKFFGFIDDNSNISAGGIVDTLMNILGAILAYKAVSGVVGGIGVFVKGFGGLIGLITTHPVAAAIVGITALAVGIYQLDKELERQRIASYFGDLSISLEEIHELVDPITESVDKVAGAFNDNEQKLKSAKENFTNIAKAVQETADSFKNSDIEQNVESFAKQLDDLLDSALEVNSATFDTSAWRMAFLEDDGVIDEREQEILDSFEDMGSSVGDVIKSYGEEIHKITQAAIDENRELTEAEIANLKLLYQELADMTLAQDKLKSEATWERLKSGAYSYDSYAELADEIKKAQEQEKKTREELQQSMYEDALSKLGSGLAAGKINKDEYEKQKAELFKEADETVKEMEVKSARYQREVILAFSQGAFKNMAESYALDDEELAKMQEYYNLLISMPKGVDFREIFSGIELDSRSYEMLNQVRHILDTKLKDHFGLDLKSELEALDSVIGDSAYATTDEYLEALQSVIGDFTGLDVEKVLPSIEEFRAYPEAYTEILNAWAQEQQAKVILGVELDTSGASEDLNNLITNQKLNLTPYVSPQNYPNSQNEQKITLDLLLNGEKKETYRFGAQGVSNGASYIIDNGKNRGY